MLKKVMRYFKSTPNHGLRIPLSTDNNNEFVIDCWVDSSFQNDRLNKRTMYSASVLLSARQVTINPCKCLLVLCSKFNTETPSRIALQCYKCQKIGHVVQQCKNNTACHCSPVLNLCICANELKCENCSGSYSSSSKTCPELQKQNNKNLENKAHKHLPTQQQQTYAATLEQKLSKTIEDKPKKISITVEKQELTIKDIRTDLNTTENRMHKSLNTNLSNTITSSLLAFQQQLQAQQKDHEQQIKAPQQENAKQIHQLVQHLTNTLSLPAPPQLQEQQ
eukprot:Pgem_evm1s1703